MDDPIVLNFWIHSSDGSQIATGHRSGHGYDTTAVVLFKKQLDNGATVPDNVLDDTDLKEMHILHATQWYDKRLLLYKKIEAEDVNDSSIQDIFYNPRNRDNVLHYVYYHNGITGNNVQIANDGSYRIF